MVVSAGTDCILEQHRASAGDIRSIITRGEILQSGGAICPEKPIVTCWYCLEGIGFVVARNIFGRAFPTRVAFPILRGITLTQRITAIANLRDMDLHLAVDHDNRIPRVAIAVVDSGIVARHVVVINSGACGERDFAPIGSGDGVVLVGRGEGVGAPPSGAVEHRYVRILRILPFLNGDAAVLSGLTNRPATGAQFEVIVFPIETDVGAGGAIVVHPRSLGN